MKDKIQNAVKDKVLYLTGLDLLRNVFFTDQLKANILELYLQIHTFLLF